jgi:hypothetical protein
MTKETLMSPELDKRSVVLSRHFPAAVEHREAHFFRARQRASPTFTE